MPGQWLIPHGGSNRVNVTDTKPAATAAVLKANYVRRGTKDRGTGHVLQRVRLTGHRVIRPTTGDTERNSGSARDVLEQVAVHDVGGAVYRNDGLSWSRDPQRGEQVRGGGGVDLLLAQQPNILPDRGSRRARDDQVGAHPGAVTYLATNRSRQAEMECVAPHS